MIMPFMAIYLQQFPQATPTKIGIAIGLGPLAFGCFSPIGGWLIDRFGCRRMVTLSLALSAVNIYVFFALHQWWYCFMMSALLGLTRSIFDIGSRTYRLLDQDKRIRRFIFGLRFSVINSAAAFGPFIGAIAASRHWVHVFHFIGLGYLALSALLWWLLRPDTIKNADHCTIEIKAMGRILVHDHTMSFLILASLLFWLVFSQIDSTLPQYLQLVLPHSLQLYSMLLVINALMCAGLQIFVTHSLRNVSSRWISRLGVGVFFCAFVVLSVAHTSLGFITYIVLLTAAELLLAPLQDYLVSVIAPAPYLGSYYGALGIAVLGFGLGPIMGGIVYQHSSGPTLFVACAITTLTIAWCYRRVFYRLESQELGSKKAESIPES